MPGSSNQNQPTSFIPKHSANKVERRNTPRRIFLGTLIVRVFFFAVLIVAVGTFAYEQRLENQLAQARNNLSEATKVNLGEMERLLDFEKRLNQAKSVWAGAISVNAILDNLEQSTLATAQLQSLELSRPVTKDIELKLSILTDSYDSVLEQQQAFRRSNIFSNFAIENVGMAIEAKERGTLSTEESNQPNERITRVTFAAKLSVPATAIPYIPSTEPSVNALSGTSNNQ